MTTTPTPARPVPRWVRAWAALTATVALLLLFVLGGFVTSFRVGMADPVWPTEPWYLLGNDWRSLEFGKLIEHTHRAAGWIVGAMVSALALGAWLSEPKRAVRWFGLAAIVFLIAAYGQFHRGMMAAEEARKANQDIASIAVPTGPGIVTLVGVGLCLAACAVALAGGQFGRWTRSAAVIALIAVMIQGLLGGFRVFLDQLMGTQLAAYHGAFAQVVFALLACAVFLAAPRTPGDALPAADRDRMRWLAAALPAAVFVQLVWGVWLRHMGSPVAQRLHVLTAFVVAGLAVWVAVQALATPDGRKQLRFGALHLLAIVAVQVMLGVEGWMAKYAAVVDAKTGAVIRAGTIEREEVSAAIRTAHVVIGTALLASATVFAMRVWRKPIFQTEEPAPLIPRLKDSIVQLGEPVSGF